MPACASSLNGPNLYVSPFPVIETAFVLHEASSGVDLDVTLDRGRIELTNLKKQGTARVHLTIRDGCGFWSRRWTIA